MVRTVTVGSLSHDSNNIVTQGQTFILTGYTVPCSGTVVAWEFCYQISDATSATFYPGIWRITGTSGNTDQFTAPVGSVVGLYSNVGTQVLHTNTDSSITTYKFSGNQSSVRTTGNNDVNYNIAIRVHLGMYLLLACVCACAAYVCMYLQYTCVSFSRTHCRLLVSEG